MRRRTFSPQAWIFGTRMKMKIRATVPRGIRRPVTCCPARMTFMDKNTLMNADTIVMLNAYPNSMVASASRRRSREERTISLSLVVKPVPVRIEIT